MNGAAFNHLQALFIHRERCSKATATGVVFPVTLFCYSDLYELNNWHRCGYDNHHLIIPVRT